MVYSASDRGGDGRRRSRANSLSADDRARQLDAHFPNLWGGFRSYETADQSVNRPLLALFALGGGWHNNHHRYAARACAGFAWWEIDPCYYSLKLLERIRVIPDVKGAIPEEILREGRSVARWAREHHH